MIRPAAALLAAALGVAAFPASALAETRKVPSEQYPTIQSAINGIGTDDVILVAKGTYPENITISGNNPFTLKGSGNPVIDGTGGDCISLSFVSNITISGFVLINAGDGGEALYATGCSNLLLSKLSIQGATAIGMHFRNGSSDITVSKCSFSDLSAEGILDESSTGLIITKCRFTNTGQAAVALSPNYYTDSGTGSNDAIVSKNKITGAGANGIHFGGSGVLVSKNKVVSSTGTGIYNDLDTSTTGAVVEKNTVTGTGVNGIYVSGSSATVSKNKVKDTNQNGIEVQGSGGHTIEKNKVVGADVEGIHAVSAGNTFTKNKASRSGDYDLYDENATGANTYDRNKFGSEIFAGDL